MTEAELYARSRQSTSPRRCAPGLPPRSRRWPRATPRRCCTCALLGAVGRRRHRRRQHRAPAGDLLHRGPAAVGARLARSPRARTRVKAFLATRQDAFAPFSAGRPCCRLSLAGLCAELAAHTAPGGRRLPRPGRPGARAVRPRRPAHAARGRPPHRAAVPERQGARRPGRRPFRAEHGLQRLRGQGHDRVPARRSRWPRARAPRSARAARTSSAPVRARVDRRPAPDRRLRLPGRTFSAVSVTLAGIGYDSRSRRRRAAARACARVTCGRRKTKLELHGVEWIRGVRVSGTLRSPGARRR